MADTASPHSPAAGECRFPWIILHGQSVEMRSEISRDVAKPPPDSLDRPSVHASGCPEELPPDQEVVSELGVAEEGDVGLKLPAKKEIILEAALGSLDEVLEAAPLDIELELL